MARTTNDLKNMGLAQRMMSALNGVFAGLQRESSLRLEIYVAGAAILLVAILRPLPIWWAVTALTIGCVLSAELINSAIEALADHLHPDLHAEIRIVKDMAAGAVLVLNTIALAVLLCFLIEMLLT
jgi:undecaprenol kinase